MDNRLFYLETHSQDPSFNLAFEEFVLQNRRTGTYLLLWQNQNSIIVGLNQNTEAEINRPFVEAHGIRVVRRTTGGGAVYHDLGNLNYSFITDAADAEHLERKQFVRPIVEALRGLGVAAEASGRNDILANGRKVSGTAQRLLNGRILHHGTLLFDSNPEQIAGALRADPSKFQSKGISSVRSRVGNIRDFLDQDMDLPAFWAYLKRSLAGAGNLTEDSLTAEELAAVRRLQAEKYDTWAWNFGRSPAYNLTERRRWDGGTLEVRLQVEQGCIRDVVFYGDFLALRPNGAVVSALRGCPFRKEDVAAALRDLPMEEYFGGIRREEVCQTLLGEGV